MISYPQNVVSVVSGRLWPDIKLSSVVFLKYRFYFHQNVSKLVCTAVVKVANICAAASSARRVCLNYHPVVESRTPISLLLDFVSVFALTSCGKRYPNVLFKVSVHWACDTSAPFMTNQTSWHLRGSAAAVFSRCNFPYPSSILLWSHHLQISSLLLQWKVNKASVFVEMHMCLTLSKFDCRLRCLSDPSHDLVAPKWRFLCSIGINSIQILIGVQVQSAVCRSYI